jgi:hypothetical protein
MTTLGHFGPHQSTEGAKSCQPKVLEPTVQTSKEVMKRQSGLTVLPLSAYEGGYHRLAVSRQDNHI